MSYKLRERRQLQVTNESLGGNSEGRPDPNLRMRTRGSGGGWWLVAGDPGGGCCVEDASMNRRPRATASVQKVNGALGYRTVDAAALAVPKKPWPWQCRRSPDPRSTQEGVACGTVEDMATSPRQRWRDSGSSHECGSCSPGSTVEALALRS
jgi:hypothetical protein